MKRLVKLCVKKIIGVNNNSKDRTEEVYKRLGLPYFNESKQSPGFARQCGLNHAKGKYHFCIDADTFYPPKYVDLMMMKRIGQPSTIALERSRSQLIVP